MDDDAAMEDAEVALFGESAENWTLATFMLPNERIRSLDLPTDQTVINLTNQLAVEWVNPDVDYTDLLAFSCARLGLNPDDEWKADDIDNAILLRRYQYKQLLRVLEVKGLLSNDEVGPSLIDKMDAIQKLMQTTYNVVVEGFVQWNRMESQRTRTNLGGNSKLPAHVLKEDTFENALLTPSSLDTLSSFQRLILIMCTRFEMKQYRKSGDACFEPIKTDLLPVCADVILHERLRDVLPAEFHRNLLQMRVVDLERVVEGFVPTLCKIVRRDACLGKLMLPESAFQSTGSSTAAFDTVADVAAYIRDNAPHVGGFNTRAFRFASSIKDEIFKIKKDVKFEHWKLLTNPRDNPKAVTEHLIESDQSEFPSLDVGDGEWFAFRDCIYNIRYDLAFRYHLEGGWAQYAIDMQRARGAAETYPVPNASTVCVNYFDQDFRFKITPDDPWCDDPMAIPTPAMEKIWTTQKFEFDTKKWAYTMTGRLFFKLNKYEKWKRCFIIVGAGGTGKSTHGTWVCHVIPPHCTSVLNSNFEEKFGLSGITKVGKRFCFCNELSEDFGMKQEEWQICVEGGVLQPATKGVTAAPHEFVQQMYMVGNHWPKRWSNNGQQITRRAFPLLFNTHVQKRNVEGDLDAQLERETDLLLRKCSLLYMKAAKSYGMQDLQSEGILPEQIVAFLKTLDTGIDPLTSFIDSEDFEHGDDRWVMPLDDFKSAYFEWRKKNGHHQALWTVDHYQHVFSKFDLCVCKHESHMYMGEMKNNITWIHGIRPVVSTGDEDAMQEDSAKASPAPATSGDDASLL